ncbi:MAG: ATP-binding cassette domain-containing protein, partial [Pseudomonadota bacterium]
MSEPLLAIESLTAGYGTVPIISNVRFSIDEQGIAVIVGPNGAGKSTLLKAVMGLNQVFSGSIAFRGQSIQGVPTGKLVPLGIAAVPQTQNVFPSLTVDENLEVGTYAAPPPDIDASRSRVLELFPDLADKLAQPAGELSGGQRQMVAVSRALM